MTEIMPCANQNRRAEMWTHYCEEEKDLLEVGDAGWE